MEVAPSLALMSAPMQMSPMTQSTLSWRAITCSAASPLKSRASSWQPDSASASMISFSFAQCSGVPPFLMS